MVEVFALTVPAGLGPRRTLAAHERDRQHEAHVAFEVAAPDPLVLRGLCAAFGRYGATPDGGGYNPHENGTVFYFTAPAEAKTAYRRWSCTSPATTATSSRATSTRTARGSPPRRCCGC